MVFLYTGKEHIAQEACPLGMTVAYFNMLRLLERLDVERLQGHAIKFLELSGFSPEYISFTDPTVPTPLRSTIELLIYT